VVVVGVAVVVVVVGPQQPRPLDPSAAAGAKHCPPLPVLLAPAEVDVVVVAAVGPQQPRPLTLAAADGSQHWPPWPQNWPIV
jgi:hypothetical protein